MKIKRALISVTDKRLLDQLASSLKDVEIISTGGTARYLKEKGVMITPIEEVSGNPEAFGGRMKTIGFNVLSSILFKRERDQSEADSLGIVPIDLVVCNLYPFKEKLKEGASFEELIENIDVGGPTMIRAAAKNYHDVMVLTDPCDYEEFGELYSRGDLTLEYSKKLAAKAFELTAHYDQMIATSFSGGSQKELRYGENPNQKARVSFKSDKYGFGTVKQLWGKEMSYNNYLDSDAALKTVYDLRKVSNESAAVIVKHLNPCGAAMGENALEKAWASDPVSSFGGIVALSHQCTKEEALFLSQRFVEIVMAPSFCDEAQAILTKKKNIRLLMVDYFLLEDPALQRRSILGGELVQESDRFEKEVIDWVTEKKSNCSDELTQFGIALAKQFKSNAIVLVKEESKSHVLMGAGMGNPNRLFSIEQARQKAAANGYNNFSDAVLVSDGFFPFADSIDLAHEIGVGTVIQPGGSIKDKEVIARCDEFGLTMGLTALRHFNH